VYGLIVTPLLRLSRSISASRWQACTEIARQPALTSTTIHVSVGSPFRSMPHSLPVKRGQFECVCGEISNWVLGTCARGPEKYGRRTACCHSVKQLLMVRTSARAPLVEEAHAHELEGIVSERRNAPYRSEEGDSTKVKTAAWREADNDRGELFANKW
jgi:hypothetical protein